MAAAEATVDAIESVNGLVFTPGTVPDLLCKYTQSSHSIVLNSQFSKSFTASFCRLVLQEDRLIGQRTTEIFPVTELASSTRTRRSCGPITTAVDCWASTPILPTSIRVVEKSLRGFTPTLRQSHCGKTGDERVTRDKIEEAMKVSFASVCCFFPLLKRNMCSILKNKINHSCT